MVVCSGSRPSWALVVLCVGVVYGWSSNGNRLGWSTVPVATMHPALSTTTSRKSKLILDLATSSEKLKEDFTKTGPPSSAAAAASAASNNPHESHPGAASSLSMVSNLQPLHVVQPPGTATPVKLKSTFHSQSSKHHQHSNLQQDQNSTEAELESESSKSKTWSQKLHQATTKAQQQAQRQRQVQQAQEAQRALLAKKKNWGGVVYDRYTGIGGRRASTSSSSSASASSGGVSGGISRGRGWTTTNGNDSDQEEESEEKSSLASLTQLTRVLRNQLHRPNHHHPSSTTNTPDVSTSSSTGTFSPITLHRARDSIGALLGWNNKHDKPCLLTNKEVYYVVVVFAKRAVEDEVEKGVSVEYAARIQTLLDLFCQTTPETTDNKQTHEGLPRPNLVCFCNPPSHSPPTTRSTSSPNKVEHDAGWRYFQKLASTRQISLENVACCVHNPDIHDKPHIYRNETQVLEQVVQEVQLRLNYRHSASSQGRGMQKKGASGSKKGGVHLHATLISTEYHLCNLNDVHHRSPGQSPFLALEALGKGLPNQQQRQGQHQEQGREGRGGAGVRVTRKVKSTEAETAFPSFDDGDFYGKIGNSYNFTEDDEDDEDEEDDIQQQQQLVSTIVSSSWSFCYATYPFLQSKNDVVVFLGRCYLLAEELVPLLVNMRGVVNKTEFFQRDNYLLLVSIRRSLVSLVEELLRPNAPTTTSMSYFTTKRPSSSLRQDLEAHAQTSPLYQRRMMARRQFRTPAADSDSNSNNKEYRPPPSMEVILEQAIVSLGRCVEFVRPAGLLVSTVPHSDWIKALHGLQTSMEDVRAACDPDEPLGNGEGGVSGD